MPPYTPWMVSGMNPYGKYSSDEFSAITQRQNVALRDQVAREQMAQQQAKETARSQRELQKMGLAQQQFEREASLAEQREDRQRDALRSQLIRWQEEQAKEQSRYEAGQPLRAAQLSQAEAAREASAARKTYAERQRQILDEESRRLGEEVPVNLGGDSFLIPRRDLKDFYEQHRIRQRDEEARLKREAPQTKVDSVEVRRLAQVKDHEARRDRLLEDVSATDPTAAMALKTYFRMNPKAGFDNLPPALGIRANKALLGVTGGVSGAPGAPGATGVSAKPQFSELPREKQMDVIYQVGGTPEMNKVYNQLKIRLSNIPGVLAKEARLKGSTVDADGKPGGPQVNYDDLEESEKERVRKLRSGIPRTGKLTEDLASDRGGKSVVVNTIANELKSILDGRGISRKNNQLLFIALASEIWNPRVLDGEEQGLNVIIPGFGALSEERQQKLKQVILGHVFGVSYVREKGFEPGELIAPKASSQGMLAPIPRGGAYAPGKVTYSGEHRGGVLDQMQPTPQRTTPVAESVDPEALRRALAAGLLTRDDAQAIRDQQDEEIRRRQLIAIEQQRQTERLRQMGR